MPKAINGICFLSASKVVIKGDMGASEKYFLQSTRGFCMGWGQLLTQMWLIYMYIVVFVVTGNVFFISSLSFLRIFQILTMMNL